MNKKKIIVFLCIALLFWAATAYWSLFTGTKGTSVNPNLPAVHGDIYFDNNKFDLQNDEIDKISGSIYAVVMPSIIDNSSMAAKAIARITESGTEKNILLIAFSDNIGTVPITDNLSWQTGFGVIESNQGLYDSLVQSKINTDSDKVGKVDRIGSMMPLLKYYLPNSQVVPLVFDSSAGNDVVLKYIDNIKSNIVGNTSIIILTESNHNDATFLSKGKDYLVRSMSKSDPMELIYVLDSNLIFAMKIVDHIADPNGINLLEVGLDTTDKKSDNLVIYYGK